MAFLFMCIFIFILCHFLSVSEKILKRKCLLAKIQENINFATWGRGRFNHFEVFIKGDGRLGTTDEFATTPFHLVLFTAALAELMKSSPVHSLILSSHLFFCPPLLLFPFTVPCKIVFAKPEDLETWPNHFSFCFMTTVRSSSYSTMVAWIFLRTFLLVILALYQMFSLRQHLI